MKIALNRTPTPRVSIIIPAASTPDLLRACLQSLSLFAPDEIPYETIAVLNETSPDNAAQLTELVTGLQVVASPVNLGLAGAGNRGRDLARGEYLVLLHDDAEIEPGWLEALVQTADGHPEAGAVGSKVLFLDGRLQSAGGILWRDATVSAPWAGDTLPPSVSNHLRATDSCGTSSLLIRAVAWDAFGGLDERFYPVYYVDHDIGMAVRQLGMVVLYQPKSRIRHHQGASSNPRFRGFAARRNQQLFLQKWAAALQEHEPKEGSLPAAIERAMARAEARAERCRREGPAALDRSVERRSFDPNQQQLQSWQRSRDFQKAYITHLGEELDAAEVERDRWQNALATGTENSSPSAAGPAYPFGTTLRFGKNGTAYRHAFTGCYSPEEWGAWMGNDPFRVLLPLADRADGTNSATQQLTMTLEAQHFLVKGRRLSPMRLLVNGTQLLEIDENRAGPQHYSVPVSPAVHGSSAHLMIEIKPANALPPDALGLSFDDRPLSIGLISLAIYRTS